MKQLILSIFFIPAILLAKEPEPTAIHWISFEEAVALQKNNPKPLLVDVYTDWCHWCKVMDKNTYTNPVIVNYINNHFYAVKLNAEQKEPITFNGETFTYVASGKRGYHQFAQAILDGKLSFPSTVFFNKKQEIVYIAPGYLKKHLMEKLIHFMNNEIYLEKDWNTFEKEFKSKL